jgi:aminopeptidase N
MPTYEPGRYVAEPPPATSAPTPSYRATPEVAPPVPYSRDLFRQGLIPAEQAVLGELDGATVYHIDLVIAENRRGFLGHARIDYTNREAAPLPEIYLRLFPNATGGSARVSAVTVGDQPLAFAYEFQNTALRLDLSAPLPPGELVQIDVEYEVTVPDSLEEGYGLLSYDQGILSLDSPYPMIPVYDDEGWNVGVPPPRGDLTYLDASFYFVRVTAPGELTLVAAGVEVAREETGDHQVVTFAAGPVRDFYLVASDRFKVLSGSIGETKVNSYALPGREQAASQALEVSLASLKSFNARIGPYPYTEYDVVSIPLLALGIEYPGIVGMALNLYDPEATISGLPSAAILEGSTAHEAAHQWFYNVVGNDQVDEAWLDEAFAQYLTGLYFLDTYGPEAAASYRASWDSRWDRVERAPIPIGLPVAAYEGREYGAIVYGRAPIFVAALAKEMGQESFDRFLRDYYQTHKWGIATTETFRQLAEATCDCDLTALFQQWVYGD